MKRNLITYIKKISPFIGIILLIFYVFINLDLQKVLEAFHKIPPSIILISSLLIIPQVLIRNIGWQVILKEQNISIGFWLSLKLFLIGFFYGSFTPGFYGQLMRIPYLKEKTDEPYGKLFINTFIETTIRTISLFFMILIGPLILLFTIPTVHIQLFSVKEIYYVIFIIYMILLLILFYFSSKHRGEKLFFHFIQMVIPRKLKSIMGQFVDTFYSDFPRMKILSVPFFLSIVTWIIVFTQEYLFVIALGLDTNIPFLAFLFLYPIANVAGFIPITFAGVGIREIVAIEIFNAIFAVTKEEIAVIAILGFVITTILVGLIGFILSLTETIDAKTHLKNIPHSK